MHPHQAPGVFSVDATDGSDLVRVRANPFGGHDIAFDTSPDGQSVVFFREDQSRRHRNLALMRVDADGSNLMQIGPWIAERYCCTASWSTTRIVASVFVVAQVAPVSALEENVKNPSNSVCKILGLLLKGPRKAGRDLLAREKPSRLVTGPSAGRDGS